MYIRILKPLEIRKKKEELTFKSQESTNCQKAESRHPGSATYDGMKCDVTVASSNSDVTTLRNAEVNGLIARKRFVPRKRSLTYSVGNFKRSLKACSRIVTFIALFLAIVTNVLGGLINIKQYERKSTVGTSASLPRSESERNYSCYYSLSILRKFLANILSSDKELWPCVIIDTNWKDNKQLKRSKGILQKSRNMMIFRLVTALSWLRNLRFGNVTKETFCLRSGNVAKKTFLAGKCLSAYLCLFADFWASHLCGLDTYTGNLELNDNFKMIYDHIYLYIYDVYRSWVFYNWATYPEAFSVKTYTLVYFSSKASLLMIKSHDRYQSIVLIGLAHVEKAYSEIQSISVHNRSYWRELRSLVTPWAWCIKEGIEPWRFEKRFIPSHVPAPTPHTRCLGTQVARFARRFEARPVGPVRREVFRQLAENSGTAPTSGWVAPSAALLTTPPPLEKGTEERAARRLPSKTKGKRSRSSKALSC